MDIKCVYLTIFLQRMKYGRPSINHDWMLYTDSELP